jgi:hypothetical protein
VKKTTTITMVLALMLLASAGPAGAGQSELAEVRQATVQYHSLSTAIDDGFVPFSIDPAEEVTCFDSIAGGMGIHYVKGIDGTLSATEPEAVVYELREDGSVKLVAVEYIIPAAFVDPADPPEVLGQTMHPHSFLPVYILHAWIWKANPDGIFADFNPIVPGCP